MRLLRALAFALAAMAAAAPALAAEGADSAAYGDAVAKLAKALSPTDYAAALDSLSSSLPAPDALRLLDLGLASLDSLPPTGERRRPLVVKAGDLALLLGLFGEAAPRYEEAAKLGPGGRDAPDGAFLLRAARCYLASGDAERAAAICASLASPDRDAALVASARLVAAWSLLLQGRAAEASSQASALLREQGSLAPARRREALFVLWLGAVDAGAADDAKSAAAALAADFPGSPEALVAAGAAAPPPLAHWYLGGLSDAVPAAPRPAAKPAAPAVPPSAAPAPSAPPAASGKRLQVGYFSLEDNAQQLREELAAKGFAAAIETRSRSAGAGKPAERRWIVVVGPGKAIADTMQRLKDAGYESYVIEN